MMGDARQGSEPFPKFSHLRNGTLCQRGDRKLELDLISERHKVADSISIVEREIPLRIPEPVRAHVEVGAPRRAARLEFDPDQPEALIGKPEPRPTLTLAAQRLESGLGDRRDYAAVGVRR